MTLIISNSVVIQIQYVSLYLDTFLFYQLSESDQRWLEQGEQTQLSHQQWHCWLCQLSLIALNYLTAWNVRINKWFQLAMEYFELWLAFSSSDSLMCILIFIQWIFYETSAAQLIKPNVKEDFIRIRTIKRHIVQQFLSNNIPTTQTYYLFLP